MNQFKQQLRIMGCCLQIEVGMVVIKLFCLVKSQKYRMQIRGDLIDLKANYRAVKLYNREWQMYKCHEP